MDKEISRLIIAYLKNDISDKDRFLLQEWIDMNEKHRILFERFVSETSRKEDMREFASFRTSEKWQELQVTIQTRDRMRRMRILKKWSVVAAVVLAMGAVFLEVGRSKSTEIAERVVKTAEIRPGSSKAVLITEDGRQIALDGLADVQGQMAVGNNIVEVVGKHTIKYETGVKDSVMKWHTLKIPRGGEFRVVFEDSTEVWLNSETELRYPVHFASNSREVFLQGEAYFKVSRDSRRPFVVRTSRMDTKVLGTSFNISAYPDEMKSHTTLEEGKVEVKEKMTGKIVRLSPGEQALLENGRLDVRSVDAHLYSLWRMDRFVFSSESLDEVLKTLGRWYNMEFFFKKEASKSKKFSGSLPKYTEIGRVLEIIEMTTDVKFQVREGIVSIE